MYFLHVHRRRLDGFGAYTSDGPGRRRYRSRSACATWRHLDASLSQHSDCSLSSYGMYGVTVRSESASVATQTEASESNTG